MPSTSKKKTAPATSVVEAKAPPAPQKRTRTGKGFKPEPDYTVRIFKDGMRMAFAIDDAEGNCVASCSQDFQSMVIKKLTANLKRGMFRNAAFYTHYGTSETEAK